MRLEAEHFLNTLALTFISFSGRLVFAVQKCYLVCKRSSSSYSSDNVDTVKVVQNVSDTLETAKSVQPSKVIDQESHCKFDSCCNSCTF